MHYLLQIAHDVDKTHPHLGNLLAACVLVAKSKKMMMIVSPRGCGKSRATNFVTLQSPSNLLLDRLSVSGLSYMEDRLNGFQGVLCVDDIAKAQTDYARITTVTTLAELVYSHGIISSLKDSRYEITNFNASALVNVQPVLLRELVNSPEWEASIQDKTLRYYHLIRPQRPNALPPELKLDWGINNADVSTKFSRGKLYDKIVFLLGCQWGVTRVNEHIPDMLIAAAALDKRKDVNQTDFQALITILRPLSYESLVMDKHSLEADRVLAADRLAILTEYCTYGQFTLAQLCNDYKVSMSTGYRIMRQYSDDWIEISKSPTSYIPSDSMVKKLKELGL